MRLPLPIAGMATLDPMADESPLQRAIQAHKGGRLPEAKAQYCQILQGNPDDGDALNFLGMLTCQSGDVPGAVELLRKSVQAVPGNPHAWVNLGVALLAGGDANEARSAFTRASELAPDLATAWYNLGVCQGRCRQPLEAAASLHKALKLEPGHIPAYESLALLLYRLGNHAEAAEVYREWLHYSPDSAVARHMLAATSGQVAPPRAENRYIKELFDAFAPSFDENLQDLGYRAPQLIVETLTKIITPNGSLDILDAGCGTGLWAPLVRPMARRLVGVDLSPRMVDRARECGLYDELCVEELCQFMRSRPGEFDVMIAADTLVYLGALEEPMAAARACLRPGGVLTFTLEALVEASDANESYRLQPHGRYAHSEAYVRSACGRTGFVELTVGTGVLRRERGTEVVGHVVTCS